MFLSEKMKFFQIRVRTSIAFVCTNTVGQQPKPTNNRKEKIRVLTSLLFLFGAFRCGNKPPVLPGEGKKAERKEKSASKKQAQG